MDSLRISGATPSVQDTFAAPGALPAALTAPVAVGQAGTTAVGHGRASAATNLPGVPRATDPAAATASDGAAAQAAAPKPALDAIGTQMVLVFDDQTHAMTVKMLDIETQKVQQPLLFDTVPASGSGTAKPASGTLVNTTA